MSYDPQQHWAPVAMPTQPPIQPQPRSPQVLAFLAMTGLVASALFTLAAGVLEVIDYDRRIEAAGQPETELSPFDLLYAAVGLVNLAVLLFTTVVFICWLYRARKNAEELGAHGFRWAPGWTIGAWFIPFANLVIPFLVVAEVDRASEPGLPDGHVMYASRGRALLGFWWAAWIASNLIDNFAFLRMRASWDEAATRDQLLAERSAEFTWIALGALGTLVAATLAVLVVRRITRDQERAAVAPPSTWA